jgi:hypothetical protein
VSLTVDAPTYPALALDFDYGALPVATPEWEQAGKAMSALTGGAAMYRDDAWLGFWGSRAVLGLFGADPSVDRIPRHREASSYLSLWVSDVKKAVEFAKQAGATLPVIPSINVESGIDVEPGYKQVYLTDSEGNGLVLTEYVGRKKR